MAQVSVNNLSKTFGRNSPAIKNVSFTVEDDETVVILGPSGSGKSTILKLIAGLETPDSGTISINNSDITKRKPHLRGMGYLSQRPALYPQKTVQQLVGENSPWVNRLHLKSLLNRYPHQLSGGEQQRVALARMAAGQTGLWLLDEPFSALDPALRQEFRTELHLLKGVARATMIVVTHDPTDAWALGRRVGVLEDGAFTHWDTPVNVAKSPSTTFAAISLGRLCLWTVRVTRGDSSGAWVFCPVESTVRIPLPENISQALEREPTDNLTLGIRHEDVTPQPQGPASVVLEGGTVISAEPVGSGWAVAFTLGNSLLKGTWHTGSPPPVGQSPAWYWTPTIWHAFSTRTGHRVGNI